MEQNDASSVENIIEDSRIRERSFGEFENKLVSEFENKAKEAGFKRWIDFSPENGETREVVRERAREFFNVIYFPIYIITYHIVHYKHFWIKNKEKSLYRF